MSPRARMAWAASSARSHSPCPMRSSAPAAVPRTGNDRATGLVVKVSPNPVNALPELSFRSATQCQKLSSKSSTGAAPTYEAASGRLSAKSLSGNEDSPEVHCHFIRSHCQFISSSTPAARHRRRAGTGLAANAVPHPTRLPQGGRALPDLGDHAPGQGAVLDGQRGLHAIPGFPRRPAAAGAVTAHASAGRRCGGRSKDRCRRPRNVTR